MRFRVEVVNAPSHWGEEGVIVLQHQARIKPPIDFIDAVDSAWELEVGVKDGLWSGPNVGRNSDGRRFVYFAWLNQHGRRFRRIKLYQDQVKGDVVCISGIMPTDGSPACSTALVVD